jgi:hypothetical protein
MTTQLMTPCSTNYFVALGNFCTPLTNSKQDVL